MADAATIHASAVLVGAHAALIRGPSGSGKSRLALALLDAVRIGALAFARLVADDRAQLETAHGRLLVRPAIPIAGLLEVRGLGIERLPFEPVACVRLVIDLNDETVKRLPPDTAKTALIDDIRLSRLGVAPGVEPLPLVLAALRGVTI
ncbi:MAG: HPr kinase/phosphatase C-terminal domain-containing protein [Rhizobiales bacterium]|nr:HPr kinase/phosphatase C-terminal domain-containing protein [Hyphomicrobiales bacterium]